MQFKPIRTERLLLRPARASDAAPLAERRNEPTAAEYQSWSLPFPAERATSIVEGTMALEGPTDGEWWMLTVVDPGDNDVLGDLVVHLTGGGRTAEVGYTFAKAAWGKGYAVEGVAALVEWLWSHPEITRVHAMLHPDNVASAQVLERTGFVFEGRTRNSFWVGDENSDDGLYGMTRSEWERWTSRVRTAPREVRLVEVTAANQRDVRTLRVHQSQDDFVSPVVDSLADAAYPPTVNGAAVVPWVRAAEADGELVGFVMATTITEAHPEPYLWRLLVDRMHQRRGIGAQILDQVIAEARQAGAASMRVSWVDERGGPGPLYLSRGFVPTGKVEDGEVEARLTF